MSRPRVKVARVRADDADIPLPVRATSGSAGADLHAAVSADQTLGPGQRALVPTGLAVAIEPGFEGQLRPRSGVALRHGVTLLNSPGTIDADYRGEICVLLQNHGGSDFTLRRGDRIAQLVIAPIAEPEWLEVDDPAQLGGTARGPGGFGHTG